MLRALITKDLWCAWRNPLPWLLNLALPLCITGIIGLAFGGSGEDGKQLGLIKFALVDEDDSTLSQFLRGAAGQDKASQYLEPVYLEREPALQQLNDSKLSAVLVIPPHFTSNYLTGRKVELELVKNPAEQIHPAVLEELLGVIVTGMNALSHNLLSEFPRWQRVADGTADYHEIAGLIDASGGKFQALRNYLNPPLVGISNWTEKPSSSKPGPAKAGGSSPKFNIFGYMLAGMTALFLLLLASQGVADLHREVFRRTFERFMTLREDLLPFIVGKALFTIVIVSIGAAILLGGGGLIFRIPWPRPCALALLTLGYVCFATGLMSTLVAVAPNERHAAALNNVISMTLTIVGGCMFPPDNLPPVMRDVIGPLLPTNWYVVAARGLWWSNGHWEVAALKLTGLGILLLMVAAYLFRRRLQKGLRA